MKAKIIYTDFYTPSLKPDDIVEIIPGYETDSEGIWNVSDGKLALCKKEDGTFIYASMRQMQIIESDTTDWDAFRRDAAKDILAAFASNPVVTDERPDYYSRIAVEMADLLINQLKKVKVE